MNKHYTFQEYIEKFSSIQDSYEYYFEQQKELDRLNNIINDLKKDIEVIEQIEDIEVMKMQLRNIAFRLKGSDN